MNVSRSDADPVAALIPWYANGTLDAAERKLVEAHLSECGECRTRLAEAREFGRGSRSGTLEDFHGHVDPRLLTDYVERPASLDPETIRWVEVRLRDCTTCHDAHARLTEVSRALEAASRRVLPSWPSVDRLWSALASTVLRPAPALAYLIALAVLVPTIWLSRSGAPSGAVDVVPLRIVAQGDRATREGEPGAGSSAPLTIAASAASVWIELETELEPPDVDPGTSFTLELLRGEAVLWSAPQSSADVSWRNGRAVLSILLYPSRLTRGLDYTIVLRAARPDDPLDGQAVFRRSLRVVE